MNTFGLGNDRIEKFLHIVDSFNNEKITFSECVHLLSSQTIISEDCNEIAILEHIANSNS